MEENKKQIPDSIISDLQMLTSKQTAQLLCCSLTQLKMFEEKGLLPATMYGKRRLWKPSTLRNFQEKTAGLDLHNRKAIDAAINNCELDLNDFKLRK